MSDTPERIGDGIDHGNYTMAAMIERLEAERDRYREALEEIKEVTSPDNFDGTDRGVVFAYDIANRALNPEADDE